MKVVLLESIKGLGEQGDEVKVSDGYALHALFPQRKAVEASDAKAKMEVYKKKSRIKKKTMEAADIDTLFASLPSSHTYTLQVNEQGTLFSAIQPKMVAEDLSIPEAWVQFEPIKEVGEHTVEATYNNQKKQIVIIVQAKEA